MECLEQKIDEVIKLNQWQGFVSGKVVGGRVIFWEAHPDSTSFPSGGHKIYHERSAIGDMLSAIQDIAMRGLVSEEAGLYSYRKQFDG